MRKEVHNLMALKTALLLLELERLENYDKWFAYYGEELYYQVSSSTSLPLS